MVKQQRVYRGGCHCGDVAFEVTADADLEALTCSCSKCRMDGFMHVIVPGGQFRLLKGEDCLSEYRFNTGVARHLFCRRCGIQSYYIPRSNPDGVSVNLRCLNPEDLDQVAVKDFDGENWEQNAEALKHLSQ